MIKEDTSNTHKGAIITCLGYICESINPEVVEANSDDILTVIVHGLRDDAVNIKIASANALQNAIVFTKRVFERDDEREFLMNVLKESCQHEESRVRKSALQCFVQIASTYYEYLVSDIQDIFNITRHIIGHDEEEVAFQAVEFWSSICDKEIEINHRIQMAKEAGTPINLVNHEFILGATQYLAEVLCASILRSETYDIQENSSLASGASTCISLMATTVGDSIVDYVISFVEENIKSPNEKNKEAAVLVFGSILEGTSKERMEPIISSAISFFFALMQDASENVRSTTSWTLSRIAQFHVQALLNFNDEFLKVISTSLHDASVVAANSCKALSYYAENCKYFGDHNPTIPYATSMITELLNISQRNDARDYSLKNTAFDAINSFIESAYDNNHKDLLELAQVFYEKLKESLTSFLDNETREDFQLDLCGSFQVIIITLGEDIKDLVPRLMQVFLKLLENQQSLVYEDTLHCVYRLVLATKENFQPYVQSVIPLIMNGIRNPADEKVFKYCLFLISDITRYVIQSDIAQYCDNIIPALMESIHYERMSMFNRTLILTCLGGIAEAIGHHFQQYFENVMEVLVSAATTSSLTKLANEKNEAVVKDHFYLREAVLEAFISMILLPPEVGFKVDHGTFILKTVTDFMSDIRTDDIILLSLQLIGEVASRFGNEIQCSWRAEFGQILNVGLHSDNSSILETAQWTEGILSKLSH